MATSFIRGITNVQQMAHAVLVGDSNVRGWPQHPSFNLETFYKPGIGAAKLAEAARNGLFLACNAIPQAFVFVLVGTNDVCPKRGPFDPFEYKSNYEEIALAALSANLCPVLMQVPPRRDAPASNVHTLNWAMCDLAADNSLLTLDSYSVVAKLEVEGNGLRNKDGVHLTPLAQQEINKLMMQASSNIQSLLGLKMNAPVNVSSHRILSGNRLWQKKFQKRELRKESKLNKMDAAYLTVPYTCDAVKFVKGACDILSNMWTGDIEFEGRIYMSSEHAYQSQKALFLGKLKSFDFIRMAGTPFIAKARANRLRHLLDDRWYDQRRSLMYCILRAKAVQNIHFRNALLETGRKYLSHNLPDPFWGIGKDGSGQNVFGRLLMVVRVEFSPA